MNEAQQRIITKPSGLHLIYQQAEKHQKDNNQMDISRQLNQEKINNYKLTQNRTLVIDLKSLCDVCEILITIAHITIHCFKYSTSCYLLNNLLLPKEVLNQHNTAKITNFSN